MAQVFVPFRIRCSSKRAMLRSHAPKAVRNLIQRFAYKAEVVFRRAERRVRSIVPLCVPLEQSHGNFVPRHGKGWVNCFLLQWRSLLKKRAERPAAAIPPGMPDISGVLLLTDIAE